MLKFILAAFAATVCWMTTARADVRSEGVVSVTVECASDGQYVECATGTDFASVKLVSEVRSGVCVYGSTWGTYGQSIWVNHSCSGRFEVIVDGNAEPAPAPAPVQSVDCRFNSVNWQPFYRVTNHWIGRPGFGFRDANTCVQAVQMSRRDAICNWVGNGFTPYDIESNDELYFASYPDLASCYAAIQ
jgi:hypothetical protein